MARHQSKPRGSCVPNTPKSPEGFWPNPEKEYFYKRLTPSWEVPRKRKTRGDTQEFFYDLTSEEIKWKYSGEVTTCNKFELLNQEGMCLSSTNQEDIHSSGKKKEKLKFKPDSDFIINFNLDDYQDDFVYVETDPKTQKIK